MLVNIRLEIENDFIINAARISPVLLVYINFLATCLCISSKGILILVRYLIRRLI
jgi:hypothetical protein